LLYRIHRIQSWSCFPKSDVGYWWFFQLVLAFLHVSLAMFESTGAMQCKGDGLGAGITASSRR
jgi:hypothetical protein